MINIRKYMGMFLLFLILTFQIVSAAPACSFCEFINISKGDPGTPGSVVTIGLGDRWYIDGVDTGVTAVGVDGAPGLPGVMGPTGPMNQTPNMTAGPMGLMNQTPNMTAGATGASGTTGGFVYYFNHSTSPDTAGYEGLCMVPAGNAENDEKITVNSALGQVIIDPYITYIGKPGLAILPAGLWRFRTFHYVDNTGGVTNVVFKIYNRTSTGTETLLFTSTSEDIDASIITEYLTSYAQTVSYPISITDRIVIKVYGQTTSVSNKQFHFVYDGSIHTSHVQTPLLLAESTTVTFTIMAGEDLKKGQSVYISGASGNDPIVSLSDNTITMKSRVVGIITSDVASGSLGLIRRNGILTAADTRSTNTYTNPNAETWNAGDLLFATSSGGMTNVRPTSGRSVKVAYTMLGSNTADVLLVYPLENPVWVTAASDEGVVLRLGDDIGGTNISIRNYSNGEVASINSYGNATFNGVNNNQYRLINVRDPVALQDAATKNYVDTKNSYALSFQGLSIATPVDGALYVFGGTPMIPSTTTLMLSNVTVPHTGTIKAITVNSYSPTAGSNEAWPMQLIKNGAYVATTQYIGSVSVATTTRVWTNYTINLVVTQGDVLEMRSVCPSWGTNPAGLIFSGNVYIE